MPLEINCLPSLGAPFKDFKVHLVSVSRVHDIRALFDTLHGLALTGIADCYFERNTVFVKGDVNKVTDVLQSTMGSAFDILSVDEGCLSPGDIRSHNIIKAVFYEAFARHARTCGFKVMLWNRRKRGWKRIIPVDDVERLTKEELLCCKKGDLAIVRGLYVMLDLFESSEAVLWVDLYNPIVDLNNLRPLSPTEAKKLGFSLEEYQKRIPSPYVRHKLIVTRLLPKLCKNDKLTVTFADGSVVSFFCSFMILKEGVSNELL